VDCFSFPSSSKDIELTSSCFLDVFIEYVGQRSEWKSPSSLYRAEPYNLTSIPTIVKLENVSSFFFSISSLPSIPSLLELTLSLSLSPEFIRA